MEGENDLETGFPEQLGEEEPAGGLEADDASPEELPAEQQIAQLQEQLNATQQQMDRQNQLFQTLLTQQQGGQQQQQQQGTDEPPMPSLDDLPNPEDDPEGFRKGLSQKIGETLQQHQETVQRSVQQQTSRQQSMEQVWERFRGKYPELAKREALVSGATSLEANNLRASGVQDVETAITADPDSFIDRVASRMKNELGEPEESDAGSGGDQEQQRQPQRQQQQGGGRTKGVSGGSRHKGTGGKQQPSPGFMQQLKDRQLNEGLI